MYILEMYELYPLRLLRIFTNACCWICWRRSRLFLEYMLYSSVLSL